MRASLVVSSLLTIAAGLTWLAPAARAQDRHDRFNKLEAVLEHFGVADDHDYGADLAPLARSQSREGFEAMFKYMDPSGQLQRYLEWNDEAVTVFRDRDSKSVRDYVIPFNKDGAELDLTSLRGALTAAAIGNNASQGLKGLRIALDPGHMGSRFWDVKTGKYVEVAQGTVSEGVINFQVCMLLKQRLEALGAQTMITRHDLVPVTDQSLETFDLQPWAEREIRNSADEPWFDRLLDSVAGSASLSELFRLFDHSHEIAKIRSESERSTYFISRLDLMARAQAINAFHPHVTLVVHFDASETNRLQNSQEAVRSYVMGDVFSNEVGSREMRAAAVRNLFSAVHWAESNALSSAIVRSLSSRTGVPMLDSPQDYKGLRVSDGVYARNLALGRLVTESAMAYVEIMHYDYTPEFRKLLARDRHAEIEGVTLDYPARLDDIVDGLTQGVLDYVGSFSHGATQQY